MASNKPFFWVLFAAGGTLAALLAPVLILLTGLAIPFGWLAPEALAYQRVSAVLDSEPVALALLLVIALLLWHAAHRLRVTAHDLGWFADSVAAGLFYGIALIGTIASVWLLV